MTTLRDKADAVRMVQPELNEMVSKMEETTKAKVFSLIANQQITPDMALAAWMEMYSYRRLGTRINEMASYQGE